MSTAGTPMGEGTMPSEDERRHGRYERGHRGPGVDEGAAKAVASGSFVEMFLGLGAIVLGILGLIDILPNLMLTVGCITIGLGLLAAGGAKAAKYRELIGTRERRGGGGMAAVGGGLTVETLGGIAGGVLGGLALIGLEPAILASVALIVLGGALMFGATATRRLANVMIETSEAPVYRQKVADEQVRGAAAAQGFLGLGALILGALTLFDIGPAPVLKLSAIITLGVGLVVSGLAIGGKMISGLHRGKKKGEHTHEGGYGRGEAYGRGDYAGGSEAGPAH